MEVMGGEGYGGEFGFGDFDSERVGGGVAVGVDLEAFAVGGGADEVDDDLVAGQWPAAPVGGDGGEQSVLDFVPFAGTWREVADGEGQPAGRGEPGQCELPQPHPVAVRAAGVGGDQQPLGVRVGARAHHVPPAGDAGHRERGGVVVVADHDEALVGGDVID